MNVQIDASWKDALSDYFETDAWKELTEFVKQRYQETTVYPHPKNLFNAFNSTPLDNVKVVILGQDPYHGPGQAHGLSFSIESGHRLPPSLQNILQELLDDIGEHSIQDGNLQSWADQGVLLLNSVLTVEHKSPASHAKKGWEAFTDYVIETISQKREHVVFILWGAYAQKKEELIDTDKHLVIKSAHPSPFSAHKGFFESKPFSKANNYLEKHNIEKIAW